MRFLFIVGHPAHIHLFKHTIHNLEDRGYEVKVVARDKDCTLELLDSYNIDYDLVNVFYGNPLMKVFGLLRTDFELLKIVRKFRPDVMCGVLDPYIAHVGKLTRIPSVIFTDTEDATLANALTIPFANHICTPSCFMKKFKRQVRYNGYHELAYLHPKYFRPDPKVKEELGDDYIVVRFISWKASHDLTLRGIRDRLSFVKALEEYGTVYVSSEDELDGELKKYRLKIRATDMHSVLYYAKMYVGEGGTTAVESAVLGTPAIHVESTKNGTPTGDRSGNFRELRDRYGLLRYYADERQAIEAVLELLERSRGYWRTRRKRMLDEKIDVTEWMTEFLEKVAGNGKDNR